MRIHLRSSLTLGLAASCAGLTLLWAQRPAPPQTLVWAPKPVKPTGWKAPNKPWTKLPEVLAKHKGQANWTETIVSDDYLHADYISMAPGGKTPRRLNPDTREWWVIQDGQIRFTIEGQEPFVASKGYLVQVPYRNVYSMETVGDKPSLRFEVNIAGVKKMYPIDETPVPVPGIQFVRAKVAGKGTYEGGNRPFIDFNAVVAGTEKQRRFIADDRAVSNIIYGDPAKLPPSPPGFKGHFHEECAEFWFILLGNIEYKVEGIPTILAAQGDIVYVPKQTWHAPRWAGTGMACRLAMNGYQDIGHEFEASLDGAPSAQ